MAASGLTHNERRGVGKRASMDWSGAEMSEISIKGKLGTLLSL